MSWLVVALIAAHVLAAIFWVGGMAFAYMILRPAAARLEPPQRLPLWQRVFARFLPWVAVSIGVLLVSGYGLIVVHFGGFAAAGLHVHLMQGTGIVMMLLFAHLYAAVWPRFRMAVTDGRLSEAGQHLNAIRRIVAINLALGILTVVFGATGRYW